MLLVYDHDNILHITNEEDFVGIMINQINLLLVLIMTLFSMYHLMILLNMNLIEK